MQIDREGRFTAVLTDWGVSESKNGFLQFSARCWMQGWFNEAWEECAGMKMEGTAFFNLAYKDKTTGHEKMNEISIQQLREALGWDGVSLQALQDTDWSGKTIQVQVRNEEYQGKSALKIVSFHPADWDGPTLKKVESSKLKNLDTLYGAKLRALAPAPKAVAKPANAPKSPVSPPTPDLSIPAEVIPSEPEHGEPETPCTREQAWAVFARDNKSGPAEMADDWRAVIEREYPGKTQAQLTPAEWGHVRASCKIPF